MKPTTVHTVLIAILASTLFLMVTPAFAIANDANGITRPLPNATISDIVPVAGIADDPAFLKWQLDILPEGDPSRALFVATSTTPRPRAGNLTSLDTMSYPDGAYTLRLRVVRKDHNYDEYLTPVRIDNSSFSASANGLIAPEEGAVISGTVSIDGVVDLPQFRRWELYLDTVEEPVRTDQLARRTVPVRQPARLLNFDTTAYPDGEYVLRLRAVRWDGNWEEYTRLVRITNGPLQAPLPAANGITAPADGATVKGDVAVVGVVHDPQFLKWQLDLLVDGDPQRAAFVAVAEGRPHEQPARLATLDTTLYPNGTHQLRLRVVRQDYNYDEYLVNIVVAN